MALGREASGHSSEHLHALPAFPHPSEMAFMFSERHNKRSTIDYPFGGSKAIVDALIRGGWAGGAGRRRARSSCSSRWCPLNTTHPHILPAPAGIEKHGGRVLLRSHIEEVLVEGGRAAGVRLRGRQQAGAQPEVIRASKAVVSNASVWDTMRLLPQGAKLGVLHGWVGRVDSWRNTRRRGACRLLCAGLWSPGA